MVLFCFLLCWGDGSARGCPPPLGSILGMTAHGGGLHGASDGQWFIAGHCSGAGSLPSSQRS